MIIKVSQAVLKRLSGMEIIELTFLILSPVTFHIDGQYNSADIHSVEYKYRYSRDRLSLPDIGQLRDKAWPLSLLFFGIYHSFYNFYRCIWYEIDQNHTNLENNIFYTGPVGSSTYLEMLFC